jgi:NADH:ubiquinone oxidoreductase subunit 6 (subunit J)
MTEFSLFIIVGALAVAAAVMMLLSENAVYSALFLIVTMGCIAFLFLLLDAAFLAMIQITVYAGAIMVLFIFVIMLLGAERMGAAPGKFHWLTGGAALLSAAFLFIIGLAITNGGIDQQKPAPVNPQVQIINAVTTGGSLSVSAGDVVLATDLGFRDASSAITLPAGATSLHLTLSEGGSFNRGVTLNAGENDTIVVYGRQDGVTLMKVPVDVESTERGTARVTVANALRSLVAVDLVDLGINGKLDVVKGVIEDPVLVENLKAGDIAAPLTVPDETVNWAFVNPTNNTIVYRMRDLDFSKDTSQVVVLSAQQVVVGDATTRPVAEPSYKLDTNPLFGGPKAIGINLFTHYLLPFELVSLLLLASMIGAIVLTHRETVRVRQAARRRVSRPLTSVIAGQVGHDVTSPDADTPRLPAEGTSPAGD